MANFQQLSTDVLLLVLSFISAADAYCASCSRRLVYLLDELHRLRPELVVSSSSEGGNGDVIVRRALGRLSSRPNVAFAFYTGGTPRSDWVAAVEMQLPKDTVILAAQSQVIQTNALEIVSAEEDFSIMVGSFPEAVVCPFNISSHGSSVAPHIVVEEELKRLTPASADLATFWKVVVVYVVGNGTSIAEDCIKELQKLHPEASIIGGICGGGDVRMNAASSKVVDSHDGNDGNNDDNDDNDNEESNTKTPEEQIKDMSVRQLKNYIRMHHTDGANALLGVTEKSELRALGIVASGFSADEIQRQALYKRNKATALRNSNVVNVTSGVFGLALGGNVPLRSIVSRGVRSILADGSKYRIQTSNIESATLGQKKKNHMIKTISSDDGMTMTGMQFIMNLAVERNLRPDYIGIRRVGEDGYTLHQVHRGMLSDDGFVVEGEEGEEGEEGKGRGKGGGKGENGENEEKGEEAAIHIANTMEGADVDMFALDGPACLEDLDKTLSRLKSQLNGEKLLGALMFSCGGRGPSQRSMMKERMADASHFEEKFSGLPCLGFYAGGEIGPMAKHENKKVFQKGKVALQGYVISCLIVFE